MNKKMGQVQILKWLKANSARTDEEKSRVERAKIDGDRIRNKLKKNRPLT